MESAEKRNRSIVCLWPWTVISWKISVRIRLFCVQLCYLHWSWKQQKDPKIGITDGDHAFRVNSFILGELVVVLRQRSRAFPLVHLIPATAWSTSDGFCSFPLITGTSRLPWRDLETVGGVLRVARTLLNFSYRNKSSHHITQLYNSG